MYPHDANCGYRHDVCPMRGGHHRDASRDDLRGHGGLKNERKSRNIVYDR